MGGKSILNLREKKKKYNYGEILDFINKNSENVKRKKPTKAQTMTVESKRAKTTIISKEKKNIATKKWQKIIQNCCYLENLTLILKKF